MNEIPTINKTDYPDFVLDKDRIMTLGMLGVQLMDGANEDPVPVVLMNPGEFAATIQQYPKVAVIFLESWMKGLDECRKQILASMDDVSASTTEH